MTHPMPEVRTLLAGLTTLLLAGAAAAAEPAPATAAGTLDFNQRLYAPQGCLRNGNTAVCSFGLVNQGQMATLNSTLNWGGSELIGIQFVDNGHVPHVPSAAYFMDRFGTRQPQLVLQHGDQGIFVLEFANVDAQVSSGAFQLGAKWVGGVAVSNPPAAAAKPAVTAPAAQNPAPNPTPAVALPMATAAAPAATPAAMPSAAPTAAAAGCATQAGGAGLCNAATRVNAAQAKVANVSGQVSTLAGTALTTTDTIVQTFDTMKKLKDTFKGLFGSKAEPTAALPVAQQQAAVVQPAPLAQAATQVQAPAQAQVQPVLLAPVPAPAAAEPLAR